MREDGASGRVKRAVFLYDRSTIMAKPWLDAGYECWCFDGQHPMGVTREGMLVKVGMWFDAYRTREHVEYIKTLFDSADIVIGFPECTNLAVSGATHFSAKFNANPAFQAEATELARFVEYVGNSYGCAWMAENPVSVLSSLWRKPDFSFHPHEMGGYLPNNDVHPDYPEYIKPRDAYPKKTCIWAGNGFVFPNAKPVGPSGHNLSNGKIPKIILSILKARRPESWKMYNDKGEPIWGYSEQHKKLGGSSLKTKNIRSATPRGFARAVFEANNNEIKLKMMEK